MRWCVPGVFFLTPLVFAPFTTEALEMNKQIVACVLIFLAAAGLLGSMLAERRVSMRGGWFLNLVPVLLLGVSLISAIFSVAGIESWLGYGGQEYLSFLTVATGVLFFYVLVNGSDTGLARRSLMALLVSSSLIGVVTLLSLLNIHVVPYAFTHNLGFNTVGNINAFISWLIPVSLVGLGFYLTDGRGEDTIPSGSGGVFMRLVIGFVMLVTVILLVVVDFWALWTAFMVGLSALIFLSFLEPKHFPDSRRLALPVGLFLLAILFLFVKTPFKVAIPVVVSPSINASFSIAEQTLRESPLRLLFGSGNGSFDLDYAKYRPVEVNNTPFWNVRFDRAQMHPLTLLATTGVLGLGTWVIFVLTVAALGLGRIMRGRQETEWKVNYALLAGWLSLFVLHILSPVNMALTILFWGLSGLLVAEAVSERRVLSFADAPRAALSVTGGFAAFSVVAILTVFALVSRHSGEIAFAKAAKLDVAGASADELVGQMLLAVERSPDNAVYQRNLATAYLAQANVVAGEGAADGDLSTEDQQRLAQVADLSIKAAAQAAVLGPKDSYNWSTNGLIYRQLMPIVQNAHNYAATMYTQAIALEPFNPAYQTDLGRVYLAVADRAQMVQDLEDADEATKAAAVDNEIEDLRIAEEALQKAIALKADYAPAHYYLAATYERQGKLEEAASRLASLTQVNKNDTGLGFQLGVIYLKMEEQEQAAQEFERILEVYPDYSNAMWYLAAIKAADDDVEGALALLRRVQALNPDNEVVAESIANLENGGSTPAVPDPIEGDQADVVQPDTEAPVVTP
jgi:tetratricopeptide (TPR) repeat protein